MNMNRVKPNTPSISKSKSRPRSNTVTPGKKTASSQTNKKESSTHSLQSIKAEFVTPASLQSEGSKVCWSIPWNDVNHHLTSSMEKLVINGSHDCNASGTKITPKNQERLAKDEKDGNDDTNQERQNLRISPRLHGTFLSPKNESFHEIALRCSYNLKLAHLGILVKQFHFEEARNDDQEIASSWIASR